MNMRWFVTIAVAIGAGVTILLGVGRAQPIEAQPIADRSDRSAITLAETDNLCRPALAQLFTPMTRAPATPPPNLFSDRPSSGHNIEGRICT